MALPVPRGLRENSVQWKLIKKPSQTVLLTMRAECVSGPPGCRLWSLQYVPTRVDVVGSVTKMSVTQ